jgi:predicted ABC-type ATPase
VSKRPRLIVIAGPNGSGKTTITEQLLEHIWTEACVYVNPDQIAQQEFGDWNSDEASLKAAQKAQELRRAALGAKSDLAFETVFSAPDKMDFILSAKAAGYFIRFFYVCTNGPEINVARVARRTLENGHSVPIAKIISRYSKSIAQCAAIIRFVDRGYIYDNSIEEAPPQLLFRSEDGRLRKQYLDPVNAWADPILHALKDSGA